MRPPLSRAHRLASRSKPTQCTTKLPNRRAFAQTTFRRNNTTPHYQPPSPKDSKGNDARLSRFSKILGIAVGGAFAFGYSVYKHKTKESSNNAAAAGATGTAGGIGPGNDGFVKYRLAAREDISSTCAIFTLRPLLGGAKLAPSAHSERAIESVLFKQPQLQVARAYTLLPSEPHQPSDELRFLIRRERGGEVSGYLHRLEVGAEVEVRGMNVEFALPPAPASSGEEEGGERVGKVVFLAGGTGIAPALRVGRAVAGEADLHVLWASREREDCEGGRSDTLGQYWGEMVRGWFGKVEQDGEERPKSEIVRRLEALKRDGKGRVAIDYFVDSEGRFIQPREATTLVRTSFSSMDEEPVEGRKIMFVSGPEGFVSAWAGPKVWRNGEETQGPLGGILGKLDLKGWEVVKL